MGLFYYAAKAFDVLERLDPNPEYWEGKRGACVGVFQMIIAGHESKSVFISNSLSFTDLCSICKCMHAAVILSEWYIYVLCDSMYSGSGCLTRWRCQCPPTSLIFWQHDPAAICISLYISVYICRIGFFSFFVSVVNSLYPSSNLVYWQFYNYGNMTRFFAANSALSHTLRRTHFPLHYFNNVSSFNILFFWLLYSPNS